MSVDVVSRPVLDYARHREAARASRRHPGTTVRWAPHCRRWVVIPDELPVGARAIAVDLIALAFGVTHFDGVLLTADQAFREGAPK